MEVRRMDLIWEGRSTFSLPNVLPPMTHKGGSGVLDRILTIDLTPAAKEMYLVLLYAAQGQLSLALKH